jgi:hypothetical protein
MRYLTTLLSFVLACDSSVIVARAQSQTTPSPEVKKLAVMVGKFTVEDEVKAGAMGPNSPATKFNGTDDCRWTAGGFAVICEAALYRPGRKYSEASFVYYDPTSKDIPIPRSRQFRRSRKQDWYGERRRMDMAWGEHFWREDVSHPVHHEGCFSGLLRIHGRVGRNRELHEGVREREGDSRRGHPARNIENGAVTVFHA